MSSKKVAVITGSGDGLGKGIAERLAQDGFAIVLSDINPDTLTATEAEFKARGAAVSAFLGDVGKREDQFALVKHAADTFGRVDVFINNAGIEDVMALEDVREADIDRVFNINIKGVIFGTQAAAEQMKKQGGGRVCKIINACSIAGHESYDLLGVYCASKHAVRALTVAAAVGYLACFASMNVYVQGFARLIWSMADEGKLPAALARRNRHGMPDTALLLVVLACALCAVGAALLQLSTDELIRYANGNFVLVYLLSMAAGVVLLRGVWRWIAVLSSLLCAAVLAVLGTDALYALGLLAGLALLDAGRRQATPST